MHKTKGDAVMTPACYSTMQPPQECHIVAHHWLAHPRRAGALGCARGCRETWRQQSGRTAHAIVTPRARRRTRAGPAGTRGDLALAHVEAVPRIAPGSPAFRCRFSPFPSFAPYPTD
jgi:hypothetical protein